MARLGQNFSRFRGDNFTIVFNVLDASDLTGYMAEWTVYERGIDGITHTITKKLTVTTDGDFDAPVGEFKDGGITFDGGEVHVEITEDDYTGLGTAGQQVTFEHQLRLWDGDDVQAVAAQGTWTIMVPSPAATLST